MTTDFRALCAELTNGLEEWGRFIQVFVGHNESTADIFERIDRARAALAAEPAPPDDGEVAELVAELIRTANDLDDDWYHGSARVARRAADLLERLAPQPVPEGSYEM